VIAIEDVRQRLMVVTLTTDTLSKEAVEADVIELLAKGEGRDKLERLSRDTFLRNGGCRASVQALLEVLMGIFFMTVSDMEAKLKRTTTLNLDMVCMQEKAGIPRAVSLIITELHARLLKVESSFPHFLSFFQVPS